MSRTRRVLLYLFTAIVTCFVWLDVPHFDSTRSWVIPLPSLPVVSNQNGHTHISGNPKGDTDTASETSNSDNAGTPEQQRTLAWKAEQRRRKVALKTACREWLPKASEYLPRGKDDLKYLLVDDKHKALYCFVPKVGCTNWKRLWMILTGLSNEDDPLDIPEEVPHWLHDKMMLVKQDGDPLKMQHKLDTYKKLLVVRDPYERLLSAYRDKLEGGRNKVYQNKAGKEIKRRTWTLGKKTNTTVTFPEFVSFVTKLPNEFAFDEHWRPYHRLCFPCAVRYTVIGKYETLTEDSERFLRLIGAPENLHFPPYVPGNTSSILPQYMSKLTKTQRRQLFKVYQRDFEAFEYQPFGGPD